MQKNLDISTEFITRRYLDNIFSGIHVGDHSLASEVERVTSEPNIGDHLITPRPGYTHHGLYVGDGKVIHYEGLYDGFKSGPIKQIELFDFDKTANKSVGFRVQKHDHRTRSIDEIVRVAYKRLGEKDYNLIWNNCEHFVHDCIYGDSKSYQVNNGVKLVAKNAAKYAGKMNVLTNMTLAIVETRKSLIGYLKGEISGKRLVEDISHTVITSSSIGYYGVLGQAAIPVPVLGFLVGSSIGFVVGNLLMSSGHLSLGESQAARISRERYEHVKALCDMLIPKVKESRKQLEYILENYFAERKSEIGNALLQLERASETCNMDDFSASLSRINLMFGKELAISSFNEFDALMMSEDAFKF